MPAPAACGSLGNLAADLATLSLKLRSMAPDLGPCHFVLLAVGFEASALRLKAVYGSGREQLLYKDSRLDVHTKGRMVSLTPF